MANYVFSTLTEDQAYTEWNPGGGDMPVKGRSVLINGGANKSNRSLETPLGSATKVSDEELALLEKNQHFQRHRERGFVHVQKRKADVEHVAKDMTAKDRSAPLTDDELGDKRASG